MPDHRETFARAGLVARPSPANMAHLVALESRLGHPLPESFREFVASDVYPSMLADFSNGDTPLAAHELGSSRWRNDEKPPPGILQFMTENQCVARWGIESGSCSGPKVLVQVDSKCDPPWRLCAETFSLWLECQVLDSRLMKRALFAAQAAPLTDAMVRALRGGPL